MSRLVAVSNRISVPKRGTAPGGLAVGLMAAMQARRGLWFGWDGETVDSAADEPAVARKDGVTFASIEFDQTEYQDFYLGFCNGTLWPLFHYFVDSFRYSDTQYEVYQRVNQRFARTLLPLLEPDDLVWVHDYHLFPLAQKLREAGAAQPIGLFLHIPFPNIEVLRVLPVYGELLQAMLAYDVLGFQTETDRDAFRSAAAYVWGAQVLTAGNTVTVGGRRVLTEVYPIGVDVDAIQREAVESLATETSKRLVTGLLDRKLMIGVDRLDYSKGLVERFKAYERFLETHPENQNRVTFMQIAPISRSDVRAYAEIRRDLEQTTGRTNGRFADTDWTPIRYLNRNFPHDVLMGFMRSALVGIVTPVRDGMNLVAKEFVAAQDPADPGVLILSTLAGAARELTSAVLVNPYDLRGMAHAIQQAFNMPLAERRERHQAMLEVLRRNSIAAWHSSFVNTLESRATLQLKRRTG
ncbi:MAG TPA: trehalose-6-phosphate synthase [Steroidobacteraceae bacterium]|jgi:trehalose 6-phosphate synthase|nr:trehalose-6-phosphate synthase [Steroidobacteraceae bacterium]